MILKPQFITFTGADDDTDIGEMWALSQVYPVEWGILFSPGRRGTPRYPSHLWLSALLDRCGDEYIQLSAHLCGQYVVEVVMGGKRSVMRLPGQPAWSRAQINSTAADQHVDAILEWAETQDVTPIIQCRDFANARGSADWLFDRSGGRGEEPDAWPAAPAASGRQRFGYAGGISPSNVERIVATIGNGRTEPYWIDMESGVRDEADRFCIAKCRAVCEAVYGAADAQPL